MATVAPTQTDVFTALKAFLVDVLPSGVTVVQGIANRVPEPKSANFVVMTIIRQERIETNVSDAQDVTFIGAAVDTILLVDEVEAGPIQLKTRLFGLNVIPGTVIVSQMTGPPGGPGTYVISPGQTVSPPVMGAGYRDITQPTRVTVQLDVHSSDLSTASDNAEIISTLFRDPYAVEFFAAFGDTVVPLYADDPRMLPFGNENQQIETRWVLEAALQVNSTVRVPQEYMDAIELTLIDVDARFPP